MSDKAAEANPTRGSRGFFAIDRGAFRCAAVGGLNAAVPSGVSSVGIALRQKQVDCAGALTRLKDEGLDHLPFGLGATR
jgi:hypothetical protein